MCGGRWYVQPPCIDLKTARLISSTGGLCGSVYLDQAFESYIKTLVGDAQWQKLKPKSKQKMMQLFEMSVKRSYAGDEGPYSVDLQGVEDNPDEGIDDDTIVLKP